MISVCFVCLGNICRSPMAELIFKDMVEKRGVSASFDINSCGTSSYETGNPVYPPARSVLDRHGIKGTHRARQIKKYDIINSDYILVMDSSNYFDVINLAGKEFEHKVRKLLDFTAESGDVADPWYTGDFERAYEDIYRGCEGFLEYLLKEKSEGFAYDKRH